MSESVNASSWDLTPSAGLATRRVLDADALAALVSSVFGAVFTAVFWIVAAFLFDVQALGFAGVLVAVATGVSTLANLGIGAVVSRVVPVSGVKAMGWFFRGNAAVFIVAMLAGTLVVLVVPRQVVFELPWQAWAFPPLVAGLAVLSSYDSMVSGLGRARWSAVAMVAQAAARLALLVAAGVFSLGSTGIAMAWFVPMMVLVPVLTAVIARKIGGSEFAALAPQQVDRGQMMRGVLRAYAPAALGAVTPTVLPLLVMVNLGPIAAGHFIPAFFLVLMFGTLLTAVMGPFVSAADRSAWDLPGLVYRFAFLLSLMALACSMFLAILAPTSFAMIDTSYGTHSSPLLYAGAAAMPFVALQAMHGSLARINGVVGRVVAARSATIVVFLLGVALAVDEYGLPAVGWWFFVSEALVAVLILPVTVREFGEAVRETRSSEVLQ
ncbi:hypothetical protein [Lolliginicoccus levis]|uniref:hypothetical protein n=1 Tax=Lolliginicoccus levis TaxID=2919542 RepID=UPI00241FF286|nr:hypothetical protein [Lolliginicoccus levis]